jgi:hypothetical protein
MDTQLALLPSPLLGGRVWAPVAERLRQRGWSATVVAATGASTPDDVLDAFLAGLPAERPLVLVPHSNAGLYVPLLAAHRTVAASVFVDAALPPPHGTAPLAPAALYDALRSLADPDGLLPPWTQWWDDTATDALFPDQDVRRHVEAEQARLPLSYFAASLEVPAGWVDGPSAYVAFGDTYADERRWCEQRGWPVTTLTGRHLHMLVEPDDVASTVAEMLATLDLAPHA